ncbi:MAG TPA: glycosyltransferase family 39 protein [Anaerolineaceae bacterium]|nr:glycosyltransferase family 39 protein [Anaerolineaceae bacterium]HPN50199.1 glycosyltransferase family 39 protein [Anaerolineaceae bacterium]
MEEPSVFDYLKSKLAFWRESTLELPAEPEKKMVPTSSETETGFVVGGPARQEKAAEMPQQGEAQIAASAPVQNAGAVLPAIESPQTVDAASAAAEAAAVKAERKAVPIWSIILTLVAFWVVIMAQVSVEPQGRTEAKAAFLFGAAAVLVGLAFWKGGWQVAPLKNEERSRPSNIQIRWGALMIGMILSVITFMAFGNGFFTETNMILWFWAIAAFIWAFLIQGKVNWKEKASRVWSTIRRGKWSIQITPWVLLIIAAMAIIVFMRVYRLDSVPSEMVSDQAEKLLDVNDVLNGQFTVYFPRNTGREALQFYWTAAVVKLFDTGVTFMALKIGCVIAGLLTLPFIYLLGKELGNPWVGFLAMFFAGVAYWPNVITRLGLRFPFYPLFVAPTLYYMIRGLRTANRNDFIWAGIALGIGLHGYTSIRILPFLVVLGFALYLIHRQSEGRRQQAVMGLVILGLISLVIFLPLGRYAVDHPELFAYRAFSRLGDVEQPLPGPAWQIFLSNLWNAVTMFFWSDGEIWVHSVTFRPALDIASGAMFFAGIVILLVRYIRNRNWTDLFLLLSVPMLMMPSILSLAFPAENPSLNRTGGAIVPVFLITAIALEGFLRSLKNWFSNPKVGFAAAGLVAAAMMGWATLQNYDLVFNQYAPNYTLSTWNTSEMGKLMRSFADTYGTRDSSWLVGYPYWVDSRLVGINAGFPDKDYAIFADHFEDTLSDPHAKMFLLNLQDAEGIAKLKTLYPQGLLWKYQSKVEGKDFYVFQVPPVLVEETQP